ncbi:hypothetical protein MN608_07624 [Microdochium nivale]|nr:hypothetical protein MN608_07624 [Microdochium nivale]
MKFTQLLCFVAAATTSAIATPYGKAAGLDARQGSNLATVVLGSVITAAGAANSSLATTQQIIQQAGSSINVQVVALIEANLAAIATVLDNGADAIVAAIAAAGGNIALAVAAFGVTQVAQLATAINQLVYLLNNLSVSLTVIITGLRNVAPAALLAIANELALIKQTISPFVDPVGDVVDAVQALSATASLALSGFDLLVPGVVVIVKDVIDNL